MKQGVIGGVLALGLGQMALAEAPKVVADIAPVHSLVAQVMKGVGEPSLLIQPEVSPHGYAMRPSEARSLQNADVVFWIGHELTPQLEDPIETIASKARSEELVDAKGLIQMGFRETAVFGDDDHDDHGHGEHDDHEDHADHGDHADHDDHHDEHDDHAKHDEHDHDEHDHDEHAEESHDHDAHEEHANEDGHDHDEHAEAGHDDHGHQAHDHDGLDPHVWLDPENGRAMLAHIAAVLAEVDPDNADTYRANAAEARVQLAVLIEETQARLLPLQDRGFVVFHDAYHYFEERFGLEAVGSILLADASAASAARLADIREAMQERGVVCVFTEPQFNPKIVRAVTEGADLASAEMDPHGVSLEQGPGLYPELIRALATSAETCLKG